MNFLLYAVVLLQLFTKLTCIIQTYEQAAADATPPYWETTILTPGMGSDDVFIDGLPVGSVFAFIWNALSSPALYPIPSYIY